MGMFVRSMNASGFVLFSNTHGCTNSKGHKIQVGGYLGRRLAPCRIKLSWTKAAHVTLDDAQGWAHVSFD